MKNTIKLLGQYEVYENKLVHVYSSVKDAAHAMNSSSANICAAVKSGGLSNKYYWKYINIDEEEILKIFN